MAAKVEFFEEGLREIGNVAKSNRNFLQSLIFMGKVICSP
jgi:hypothetical protein